MGKNTTLLEAHLEAAKAFSKYVSDMGYDPAVEVCPCDGGELMFTDGDAYDLISDFLADHPEYEACRDSIENEAEEIGQISKYARSSNKAHCMEGDGPDSENDDEEAAT